MKNPHKLNLPLFLKIVRVIEAEPKRVHMSEWWGTKKKIAERADNTFSSDLRHLELPACGTVACIAGWAYILSDSTVRRRARKGLVPVRSLATLLDTGAVDFDEEESARMLGFKDGFYGDAMTLFYVENWGNEEAQRLYRISDAKNDAEGRARAVVMQIESFLKSKGVSLKQFYAQEV